MNSTFVQSVSDGEVAFDIAGRPEKSEFVDKLLIFSTCIFNEDGSALLTHSGQIIPELQKDGSYESIDELSFFAFDRLPSEIIEQKTLTAEVTIHCFDTDTIQLSPVNFSATADVPKYIQPIQNNDNAKVKVVGQYSTISTEGGKNKKIEFLGSGTILQNRSEETVYVTYYVGTKANTAMGHLGRIGLLELLPHDSGTLALESYHEAISDALGIKTLKAKDLDLVTLYPFLCAFSNRRTQVFKVMCE
jgi:hypothetical protein